jgi:hypothetical protein
VVLFIPWQIFISIKPILPRNLRKLSTVRFIPPNLTEHSLAWVAARTIFALSDVSFVLVQHIEASPKENGTFPDLIRYM